MRYRVYRGIDSTYLTSVDSTAQLTLTNSGLSTGMTYFYRVSAVDSTGFEGVMSYAAIATMSQLPAIISFTPTRNALNVAKSTDITITFDKDIQSIDAY